MPPPVRDAELVQIVDAALTDAALRARKSDGSSWLACRPGCTPCCHGVFKVSRLDAERLQAGLLALEAVEPSRAEQIRTRAGEFVRGLAAQFPGEAQTGVLDADESHWERFADLPEADAPCPVLDPVSGTCELYASRPLTCRIFGPPVRAEDGIGVCELCYVGADEETVLHGQMFLPHESLEEELTKQLSPGETVIAWAIATAPREAGQEAFASEGAKLT